MTAIATQPGVGGLVRHWRQRRRLSQQALSDQCGVSTRHLSYIETGKASPSRDMINQLGEALAVPLRIQRELFTAAGYAPPASELPLDAPALTQVNSAIEAILSGHEPYPALVIDGGWDLIAANDAAYALLRDIPAELLEPPVNVVRLSLDKNALGGRLANYEQWAAGILGRIKHEYDASGDARLKVLLDDFADAAPHLNGSHSGISQRPEIVLTIQLLAGDDVLSFFTTTTVFGTPRDVTVAELAIEALYPADEFTRHQLRQVQNP